MDGDGNDDGGDDEHDGDAMCIAIIERQSYSLLNQETKTYLRKLMQHFCK